jgi:hypothetical protein
MQDFEYEYSTAVSLLYIEASDLSIREIYIYYIYIFIN